LIQLFIFSKGCHRATFIYLNYTSKYNDSDILLQVINFLSCFFSFESNAQAPKFRVISFYTAKNDLAHISFVHEANKWFSETAEKYQFTYDSTNDWNNLNTEFLSRYQVVLFFDTDLINSQREAFRKYMENGGAWMVFHFAGFALTPSAFPQNGTGITMSL
jgi:hypothetical protein